MENKYSTKIGRKKFFEQNSTGKIVFVEVLHGTALLSSTKFVISFYHKVVPVGLESSVGAVLWLRNGKL